MWRRRHNMPLTLEDLKDRLRRVPEVDLLELLEITSEELVDRFGDRIDEKIDYLEEDLEW